MVSTELNPNKMLSDLVISILIRKNISRKQLSNQLNRTPSEIKYWLSGDYDYNLMIIAKISVCLKEKLIII